MQTPSSPQGRATRTGTAGAALIAFTLACSVTAIAGAWWLGARSPNWPVERYLPAGSGAVYRIVHHGPAQPDSILSMNTLQRSAAWMLRQSNALVYTSLAEAMALGSDTRGNLQALSQAGALYARSVEQASIHDARALTITEDNYLLQPNALLLVMERTPNGTFALVPPLPVLRTELAIDQTHVTTGVIASLDEKIQLNFTGTLTLEARAPAQIGNRRFDDCLRVRNSLTIGTRDTGFTRTWFCAGAGVVQSESHSPDGTLLSTTQLADASALPPANSDALPTIGTLLTHTVDWRTPLTITWKFDNTDGVSAITTAPVIAGDVVIAGTFPGDVIALDLASGEERWRYHTGGPVFAAPAVQDGTAYVGSSDRSVHAIDAATGAFRWRFATQDAVVASPAVSGNVVYAGSEDRALYALDARTGALLHSFTTGGPIAVAPTVHGNTVYAGSDDGALYALNANNLTLRWAFAAGAPIASAPLATDDRVYVGALDGALYALKAEPDGRNGEADWQTSLNFPVVDRIQAQGDTLFAAGAYDLFALDSSTGQQRWRQTNAYFTGAPLVLGDQVYILSDEGVTQFDAATGRRIAAMLPTTDTQRAGLGSDGTALYAGTAGGDLFALAPR